MSKKKDKKNKLLGYDTTITVGSAKNYDWDYIFNSASDNIARYLYPKATEEEFVSPIDHHIYDPPFTHVWWKDGTKTVVATHDEPYTEEYGLAMAWMRKIYPSRAAFLRDVEAGFRVKEK